MNTSKQWQEPKYIDPAPKDREELMNIIAMMMTLLRQGQTDIVYDQMVDIVGILHMSEDFILKHPY